MKILALLFVITTAAQAASLHSPARQMDESFDQALTRYRAALRAAGHDQKGMASVVNSAVAYGEAVWDGVPSWTATQLRQTFSKLRDQRFLPDPLEPSFLRRLTWLYPDDGCYARATLMNEQIANLNLAVPMKLFAFGNLRVETPNNPDGEISWWYHVAPVVKTRQGVFVLDPSIDAKNPMPVEAWLASMLPSADQARVSVCAPTAYVPESHCARDNPAAARAARNEENKFLRLERERIQSLGRDPDEELGEHPPWTAASLR